MRRERRTRGERGSINISSIWRESDSKNLTREVEPDPKYLAQWMA